MKRYPGIRHIKEDRYEVNFCINGSPRVQIRVNANSRQEASQRRSELIAEALKAKILPSNDITFETIWPILESDMLADNLGHGVIKHLGKVYDRLFMDFRLKRYPQVVSPAQLTAPFFLEYKTYYRELPKIINGIDVGRKNGLNGEIRRLKSLIYRLRKFRYCPQEVIEELKLLKTPEQIKRKYPELTMTQIKAFLARIKSERPDLYGPVYFMARTGRRVEETTLIERDDIKWNSFNIQKINIRPETTKMNREAPLNYLDDELQQHIRYYYNMNKNHQAPYLFLNQQYRKVDQRRVSTYLGSLSQEMFGVRLTAHYFRHRFCTETCKARLPLVDIKAISGIKNTDILIDYYCHSSVEGQASVLERTRLF